MTIRYAGVSFYISNMHTDCIGTNPISESQYLPHLDLRNRQKRGTKLVTQSDSLQHCYKQRPNRRTLLVSRENDPESRRCLPDCSGSLPKISSSCRKNEASFLHLYTLYSSQTSPSYRSPAKPPPPPPPPPEEETKHDETRSRRQVTRSKFQKLMRIKRAESIIASLKRGAAAAKKNESIKKPNDDPLKGHHLMGSLLSAIKQSRSTFGNMQHDPGCIPEDASEGASESH